MSDNTIVPPAADNVTTFEIRANPDGRPRRSNLALIGAMLAMSGLAFDVPRYEVEDRSPRVTPSPNRSPRVKGSQRNDPCACGSGRKRKNCPCGGFGKAPTCDREGAD